MEDSLNIAECDVLVVAGDICPISNHSPDYQINWLMDTFCGWLEEQPAREKILVAGNHDIAFEEYPNLIKPAIRDRAIYLRDSEHVFEGVKFYGSPWQPPFYDWAFNAPEEQLALAWQMVPDDVDVLITHGPAYGLRDMTTAPEHAGSSTLRYELDERLRPELHVFGHIHEAHGYVQRQYTLHANVSICNGQYKPINQPLYYDVG